MERAIPYVRRTALSPPFLARSILRQYSSPRGKGTKNLSTLADDEKTILELTNKARAEKNLPPLTVNPLLTAAAKAHSANMAKKGEMNHVLDGKNPADRVKEAGYRYSWTGENINGRERDSAGRFRGLDR